MMAAAFMGSSLWTYFFLIHHLNEVKHVGMPYGLSAQLIIEKLGDERTLLQHGNMATCNQSLQFCGECQGNLKFRSNLEI